MNLPELEQMRVSRALQAAQSSLGPRPNVGTSATLPNARFPIQIDPVTGWPVEYDDVDSSVFVAGDVCGQKAVG